MIVILMGVTGCGKTTIGRRLADVLAWEFLDADNFHPPENIAKMRAGTALTDSDRIGWLSRLRGEIAKRLDAGSDAVLACSALRQAYRDQLYQPGEAVRLVFLKGDFSTIESRLVVRKGHYMPATLLASQFATLEEPGYALTVSVELSVEEAVLEIVRGLGFQALPPVSRERIQSASRPDGS